MKQWIAAAALVSLAGWTQADGLQSLEKFMTNSQAGEAQFTQTVTSPPKQGQSARVKNLQRQLCVPAAGQVQVHLPKAV